MEKIIQSRIENLKKEQRVNKLSLSICQCAFNRALELKNKDSIKIVFGGEASTYLSPEESFNIINGYLDSIENGEDIFNGAITEKTYNTQDHTFIVKDGIIHLFFIRYKMGYNWSEKPANSFGHAISQDLINWEFLEPVLECPQTGWDSFQVWAPHIILKGNIYYMFYTGVDFIGTEAIGLAISRDLYNWERVGDKPIYFTPSTWGYYNQNGWSDCRDPMILEDNGKYYMYYTAMKKTFDGTKPCIGIAISEDLLNFNDGGYIDTYAQESIPQESPFVYKKNDKYYLFYTHIQYTEAGFDFCSTTYLESKSPLKDFKCKIDNICMKYNSCASEIFEFKGKTYISYIDSYINNIKILRISELKEKDLKFKI